MAVVSPGVEASGEDWESPDGCECSCAFSCWKALSACCRTASGFVADVGAVEQPSVMRRLPKTSPTLSVLVIIPSPSSRISLRFFWQPVNLKDRQLLGISPQAHD